ncbi:MAPEG family protein [Vibrio marisflavi]|uniref:Inner membrane protein YecN n=1 Tax=Vibrio marisflavi CECT 7928 TaxID=634439 RepID=A0ABM9A2D1_9VIBR|nr:MAPEG family protein [Vibrio marisflavi]CAH0537823.1 Inner membrane protein YecN [Vibrio marisflavi CECT 7928]
MVTALYASVLAGLIVWLSFKVINQRKSSKVPHSDGGVDELVIARSAHSNAVEYIPITLILLALAEFNGASAILIHIFGTVFFFGRWIHANAILNESIPGRVRGMKITFVCIVGLILLNLIYVPLL